jgi:hypothetical protein
MNVKTIARPGVNPREAIIFEQQTRFKEVTGGSMLGEKGPGVPRHQQAKSDPEKHDQGNVDGCESTPFRSRQ